jgi:arabinose-5-phosphate isomerase
MDILGIGKRTLELEAETLFQQVSHLNDSFVDAVNFILQSKGKIVVTGMGKSGIVGRKIAATFSSTGTPSFFMHPGEAYHGDLGMVEKDDVLMALSFSGETDEILRIIPFFQSNGNAVISMTGNSNSTLAKNSKIHLGLKVEKEACPLSLAPTSSTTLAMAMGDALAVALMETKAFKPEDFARFHPGGSLGRKLLAKVEHKMSSENLPVVKLKSSFSEIIHVISEGRLGLALVNEGEVTRGIITDGDLRRLMEVQGKNAWDYLALDFMTRNPQTVQMGISLHEAEEVMRQKKITSLPVVDREGKTLGVIQIYDLN